MSESLIEQLRSKRSILCARAATHILLQQGRIKELEDELQTQTHLIEQFFALMDITEQTDEGRYFKPNRIYSRRVMDAEKLEKVLAELKRTLKGSDFDIENLDPDQRSWYYDGDGTKRRKE